MQIYVLSIIRYQGDSPGVHKTVFERKLICIRLTGSATKKEDDLHFHVQVIFLFYVMIL